MEPLMNQELTDSLGRSGIIAVLVIDEAEKALKLAEVLLESGITAMELTLRTPAALEAVRIISQGLPEMSVGTGTVLTPSQVREAQEAGALFGVAPGWNPLVVGAAKEIGFPFAPGVATPSEIEGAWTQGCQVLKFFNAQAMGGVSYLKGINAPYAHLGLKYIPLGGLKAENMGDYLEREEVLAIGGSWIAPRDLIKASDWSEISDRAKAAISVFRNKRGVQA